MLGANGIAAIFEWIEQLLISSLRRNLVRHKDEEKKLGFSWSAWQAEKLKNIERFRRENRSIMSGFTEQIDTETRQLMQEQFAEGVNGAASEAGEPAAPAPGKIFREPQFFGVDSERNRQLIEDICTLESKAETAALRLTDDVYRQTVIRVTLAMSTGSMTLAKAVDTAVQDFLDQGINCIVYKDGRRVNIADYVRMALRTAATRSAIEGKCAGYKALGFDTVAVSAYGMCSKTCEPWQGRVYIDDAFSPWSGETELREGIMWGRSGYCGEWFPLLSSAIGGGLFHPNCRHSVSLWRWGDRPLRRQDNTESERRYKLEQRQRALEREIRKAKRRVAGFTDPENIRQAKRELREAQKKLRDFIDQTNTAEGATILKRKPELEKVFEGELTGGANGGIIKSIDVDDYNLIVSGKKIAPEVNDVILTTMKRCEKDGGFVISEISDKVEPSESGGTPLLQIVPLNNGLLKLNINSEYLSGKTLEEVNSNIANTKAILANDLRESVIHESGHAKFLKGRTIEEVKKLYKRFKHLHINGVSEYAYSDVAELLAEVEVLISRKERIPPLAKRLYDKYVLRR